MVTADARLAQGLMGTPFGEYVRPIL